MMRRNSGTRGARPPICPPSVHSRTAPLPPHPSPWSLRRRSMWLAPQAHGLATK